MKHIALAVALFALFALTPARADEVIETYRARLSARDHFNTSGGRLTSPAAIIRQDRANFHRYGAADKEDDKDHFFASAKNREILEQLLERGRSSAAAYQAVVNGTPLVEVSIVRGDVGTYITVNIISM